MISGRREWERFLPLRNKGFAEGYVFDIIIEKNKR